MAACIPVRMRLWESQMLSSTMCDVYCLRRQDRSEKSRTISLHFHLFLRLIIYIHIHNTYGILVSALAALLASNVRTRLST
jgi:hypothetical protein